MLRKEDFVVIESLNKRGVYLKDIAAELDVHPRTAGGLRVLSMIQARNWVPFRKFVFPSRR